MAASAITDIFEIVAHGQDPPAPTLCAAVLQHKGELDNAFDIYLKVLKKLEEKHELTPLTNDEMISLAETQTSIAELKSTEGDLPTAVDFFKRALTMNIGTVAFIAISAPPKHKEAAPSAALAKMLGQNLEAQAAERAAREKAELEAALAAQPPYIDQPEIEKHKAIATIHAGLAGVLHRQNKNIEATKHFELAFKSFEASEQHETAEYADALFSLAEIKLENERVREAIGLFQRCLEVETVCSGPLHVRTDQVARRIDELQQPLTWQVPDPNAVTPTVESVLAAWVPPPEGSDADDDDEEEEDEGGDENEVDQGSADPGN